jgi:hypothetical protein
MMREEPAIDTFSTLTRCMQRAGRNKYSHRYREVDVVEDFVDENQIWRRQGTQNSTVTTMIEEQLS